jgi:glycosyltransferase involved in cell wall biosynthesis
VKVLILCAVDFTAYHLLRPLGVGLRDAGFDVTFCCSPGPGLDLLRDDGFRTAGIEIARSYNLARHARSFFELVRFMRRERFDVVHAHTPVAGIIGRIAAKLARVPVIIYTSHGFYFHEGTPWLARALHIALERFGAALSDLIFVVSAEDYQMAIRERIAPARKLIHIPNGANPEIFDRARYKGGAAAFRHERGIGEAPIVGYVGRIVLEKGVVEFVRAAAQVRSAVPAATFVMVGAPLPSDRDDCWDEVLRLRDELGLGSSLVLTGYRRDVPHLLAAFDLFALPSYREGMPYALLEAMATGLPVVATDIRGCREEVVDGLTGFLVPPRNADALAGAIVKILSSPDLATRMGKAARDRILASFDERVLIAREVACIGELAARVLGRGSVQK